ncbi:MAG: NUDIX hydrolase [Rhodothermales bacterium]|nr:NUDIX hydrolase [Rhodothermales bacterium]
MNHRPIGIDLSKMLYYFNATDKQIQTLESGSDIRVNGTPLKLDRSLRRARKRGKGSVVAISSFDMPDDLAEPKSGTVLADRIPSSAVLNVNPFQALRHIVAGGGIVTRRKKEKLQVLLIYRKGVWDLPKGKRQRKETIEECALREVSEELGITNLTMVQSLGATMHGFSQNRYYRVKTTHWYEMHTSAKNFTPQASEGIEQVKWFKWKKARKLLGYKTLRLFLDDVRELIDT